MESNRTDADGLDGESAKAAAPTGHIMATGPITALSAVDAAPARFTQPPAGHTRPAADSSDGAAGTRWTKTGQDRALTAEPPAPLRPHSPRDERFSELVRTAADRDPVAVQRVMESIRPLVVRYCRARIDWLNQTYASADDVAQEVCLAVTAALPAYRDLGEPFLAFVYGIAQHKVADVRRAVARNRSLLVPEVPDQPATVAGPEQQVLLAELNDSLRGLLAVLSDRQREIVLLRVVVGLSAEETAGLVGSTPGAVRVAQHRALALLRSQIGDTQEFRDQT